MRDAMSENETSVVEYDIRGQICPSCLLMALNKVNELKEALKQRRVAFHIITDSRQATSTIPNTVDSMGYRVEVKKEGGHYRIEVSGRS